MSTASPPSRDLIVLVPDKNMELALRGLLELRTQALAIRPVSYDLHVHPQRDPGCLLHSADFLRPFTRSHRHALVMFDHDGCGQESASAAALEQLVLQKLSSTGWDDRAEAVVLVPELEVWVWSSSPHVPAVIGWAGQPTDLPTWLNQRGLWQKKAAKPQDPKSALETALRQVKKPRSSALFQELASKVSLEKCLDPAFEKLKHTLRSWFPLVRS
jgi:hypothetical protein